MRALSGSGGGGGGEAGGGGGGGWFGGRDDVQRKVKSCAEEALHYLEARKDFWQQQKPVYARENESMLRKKGTLFKARRKRRKS